MYRTIFDITNKYLPLEETSQRLDYISSHHSDKILAFWKDRYI